MISIENIEIAFPYKKLVINKEYKNVDNIFLRKKIGAKSLPRVSFKSKDKVVNLCYNLAKKKLSKTFLKKIKVIVLCTQNPDYNGLPHNSAIIHSKLDLNSNVATFDISQGCAGYLYGIKSVESFLNKNEYGILFTCDPYSKIIKKKDYQTDILFGDAVTLSVLKKNGLSKKLYDSEFYTFGRDYDAIININNYLSMDGKRVMKFCSYQVPNLIRNFLRKRKLKINDIDQFFFHQGSKHIVNTISKKLCISNKIAFINDIGNTVSSSIPILMKKYNYKKRKKIITCGFGVGLSVSIGLFK